VQLILRQILRVGPGPLHAQLSVLECAVRMKGLIEHAEKLIEMVLVLVIIGIVLFMTVPQVSAWIKNTVFNPLTGQGIPIGTEEATILEEAISCSYARCAYGCGSQQVKAISIGEINECQKNYCDDMKLSGKVCGQNAAKNPVKVTVLTSQALDKSKTTTEKTSCMVTSDGCYGYTINGVTGEKGWIFIQKGATTDKAWEEEKCNTIVPYLYQISGYSKILIDAGNYNVWTDDQGGTVVCNS